jgi:hypothetical protein
MVAYVRKPFLANVKEVSNPIPVELPVTTATFWLDGDDEEAMYYFPQSTIALNYLSQIVILWLVSNQDLTQAYLSLRGKCARVG